MPEIIHLSINDQLEHYPQQRNPLANVKGYLLYLPRTELTVVPYREVRGGWNCVIVDGNTTYPVGGYDILVGYKEVSRATLRSL